MKAKSDDGALPVDPNGMGGNEGPDSSESANRPRDVNRVTSGKAIDTSETDNRPSKPTV